MARKKAAGLRAAAFRHNEASMASSANRKKRKHNYYDSFLQPTAGGSS
jgi:hypothetical protein